MNTLLEESAPVTEPWALRDLPPFPWITTKVLQLFSTAGDDVEARRLTELIRTDASLASELLRRANSALFGLRSQVSSIEHAVTMLGLERVKTLAMTLGLGSYLKTSLRVAVLRHCWRHSLGCALLGEEFAEACGLRPDQAYTAGLLHDVGRLALLVKYPQSYANLLSVVIENHFSMLQSERDLFDIDHCEAGSWLAEGWDFPEELVQVIGDHHRPPSDHSSDLLRLIHVTCRLADSFGFSVTNPASPEKPEEIIKELPKPVQLDGDDLVTLKDSMTDRVNALE